ncbi:MAG: hypothetical protein R6W90_18575 [Ignavibacteriaceae bacterium]
MYSKKQFAHRLPFYLFAVIFLVSSFSAAQTRTSLDIFYALADSSAKKAASELPASVKEIGLELNSGTIYSVFNTKIISAFNESGIKTNGSNDYKVLYVIDDASVSYGKMFRDGFLGDYLLERKVNLKGNYFIAGYDVKDFSISFEDTISVEEVKELESYSFPFTQGKVPAEPFFSGLFEPVVAIGTAALAVILFFTIRSK